MFFVQPSFFNQPFGWFFGKNPRLFVLKKIKASRVSSQKLRPARERSWALAVAGLAVWDPLKFSYRRSTAKPKNTCYQAVSAVIARSSCEEAICGL